MTVKGTLKYRKVERTPQVGKDAGKKKYYATAVQDRTMEFEDFVTHIAEHNSPYSRGTVHGVLMDPRLPPGTHPRRQERPLLRPRSLLARHELSW